MKKLVLLIAVVIVSSFSTDTLLAKGKVKVDQALENATRQYLYIRDELNGANKFPKTYNKPMQRLITSNSEWWCSGFYPGTLFYLYGETGNKDIYAEGVRMLKLLEPEQYNVNTHDVGFMMYCSYGNANRLAPQPEYKDIMVNSARSLISRFSPVVGCIKSHNRKPDDYVVIIDNMMNLELLFWAARNGGGQYLYDIACKHAETTMKHQFRKDYSCYHVAVYDTLDGHFIKGVTHQGLSDDSMWARGQAWAIYGYTMVYRETHDVRFLDFARKVSDVYLSRIPEDMIPYWDFNAPELSSGEPKDASAAAITASALLELSTYINNSDSASFYRNKAVEMLQILSSPAYQARNKKDAFLLHSVGHMNKGWEVDASISYADYYYLEALVRLKRLKEKQSVLANL